MTREQILKEGRVYLQSVSSSWQLDAELLLAHVLRISREQLISHLDVSLSSSVSAKYHSLLKQRYNGVPLPYLVGTAEFYSRSFIITKHVLVPRPESETIIDEAKRWYSSENRTQDNHTRTLAIDIGTGSGILAVTLAKEIPDVRVIAADRSTRALTVAHRNARKHKILSRVSSIQSDLIRNINAAPTLLIANLPYVPSDELLSANQSPDTQGLQHEPQYALDGGPDGCFLFRRLASQLHDSPAFLSSLKCVILEHAPDQQQIVAELMQHALPALSPHTATPYVTVWK